MSLDLSSPEAIEFADYLRSNGYWSILPLVDERYACLSQFAYTCAILTGRWGDRYSYEDRWCYHNKAAAIAALLNWATAYPRPAEPSGWHRHPASGRRRPDGDPAQEYIRQ